MGYGVYEDRWNGDRWAGYMVPAHCDFPGCEKRIDRGLGYQCEYHSEYDEHQDEYLPVEGCYLYFCSDHLYETEAHDGISPKPDLPEWLWWVLSARSWEKWREENPRAVLNYTFRLRESGWRPGKSEMTELFYEMEENSNDR